MADRLHASATSDRKLRTILLFRQPVATGLRSGRKGVKPDHDVWINGECRWSKACGPDQAIKLRNHRQTGGRYGAHVLSHPPQVSICPVRQPAAAALAASVAAYEPELVVNVLTNISWIAAAWALTAWYIWACAAN
jgi:hypothetical protein